ncbi:MAG TPA: BON domain-containing protein [Verrucomicrobiae bacterium]|jgi:hypothetical protein|nr:BON domain-containing protein [Verrucomicrobiae bacterium]
MQYKTKRFILAGCLAASVATAGLTGCHTEDRSAGRYMDDRMVARRVEGNLKRDPVYKYPDVRVSVFEGVAQLSGFVDSQRQIATAAEHASRTDGVREVINDISLKPQFKLVPAANEQSGRRWESNTGGTGSNVGENTGKYNETAPQQQRAPIITPNQATPATPPTSNSGNNQ